MGMNERLRKKVSPPFEGWHDEGVTGWLISYYAGLLWALIQRIKEKNIFEFGFTIPN